MHCLSRFHKIADLDGGGGGLQKLNKLLTEIEIILQNLIGTGPKMTKLKEILSHVVKLGIHHITSTNLQIMNHITKYVY